MWSWMNLETWTTFCYATGKSVGRRPSWPKILAPPLVASSYVPLSCVKQMADIAILRDFDISALRIEPSKAK